MIDRLLDFFGLQRKQKTQITTSEPDKEPSKTLKQVHALWDYLKLRDNTQVYHLVNVIGFEEWIDMTEIRRRVKELYGMEYKNEKSLYPYLKTLVDLGLMENTFVGGKMRWRKKTVLISLLEEEEAQTVAISQVNER